MSTAANHRKRSHRSQRMHYQAAGSMRRKVAATHAGKLRPSPFRGWMRNMFRKVAQHERAAEGGAAE